MLMGASLVAAGVGAAGYSVIRRRRVASFA